MHRSIVSNEPSPESPPPQAPPEPSYAPFLLALGITMVFWGIVTSPVMSIGGFVLLVSGLWLWIRALAEGWSKRDARQTR
jgi:hypothetical protein